MKKLLFSLLLAMTLSGCYVYGGTSGYATVEAPPVGVVFPTYFTIGPVCCNVFFNGGWHYSHHHWNHGYHRGWHHRYR